MSDQSLRWRKFSPLDRDSPIFELLAGDVVILDVAIRDPGSFEIAFHSGASGRILDIDDFEKMLGEAKELLRKELKSAI